MSLLNKIKNDVKKSGGNKGKFIYFKEGQKQRIRFLNDMEDGLEVEFHDSFTEGINVPCQETFGKSCPYCDREDLRTRTQYVWSVWNYDTKEVQLFMFPVNNCSPLPALVAMYENYGTLCDRDYVISTQGKQTTKTYSVVPMGKVKFRNAKAKPFSKSKIYELLQKAFPIDDDIEDDEDIESESSGEYDDMTAKELYKLCKERDIEAKPKKKEAYYIGLLEEWDAAQDDWDDDDEPEEDEDWEDDEWEEDDE